LEKDRKCVPLWRKYYFSHITVWCEMCRRNKSRCSFTDEYEMLYPPTIVESRSGIERRRKAVEAKRKPGATPMKKSLSEGNHTEESQLREAGRSPQDLRADRSQLESLQQFDDIVEDKEIPKIALFERYAEFRHARIAEDSRRVLLDSRKDAWEYLDQKFLARLREDHAMIVDEEPVAGPSQPRNVSPVAEEKIVEDQEAPVEVGILRSSDSEDEYALVSKSEGKKKAAPRGEKKGEEAEEE
jgi:hypothetical protein